MKIEYADLELVGQSFLFSENISLRRNDKISVKVDDLNVADLEIIRHHIDEGNIKSNVPSEVFKAKALELRSKFIDEALDEQEKERLLSIQDQHVKPEIKKHVTEEEAEKEKEKLFTDEFTSKIVNVSAPSALIALKTFVFENKEEVELAIKIEESNGNRRGVMSKLKDKLKEFGE